MPKILPPVQLWNTLFSHKCKKTNFILVDKDKIHFKCAGCFKEYLTTQKAFEKFRENMNKEKIIHRIIFETFKDHKHRSAFLRRLRRTFPLDK